MGASPVLKGQRQHSEGVAGYRVLHRRNTMPADPLTADHAATQILGSHSRADMPTLGETCTSLHLSDHFQPSSSASAEQKSSASKAPQARSGSPTYAAVLSGKSSPGATRQIRRSVPEKTPLAISSLEAGKHLKVQQAEKAAKRFPALGQRRHSLPHNLCHAQPEETMHAQTGSSQALAQMHTLITRPSQLCSQLPPEHRPLPRLMQEEDNHVAGLLDLECIWPVHPCFAIKEDFLAEDRVDAVFPAILESSEEQMHLARGWASRLAKLFRLHNDVKVSTSDPCNSTLASYCQLYCCVHYCGVQCVLMCVLHSLFLLNL